MISFLKRSFFNLIIVTDMHLKMFWDDLIQQDKNAALTSFSLDSSPVKKAKEDIKGRSGGVAGEVNG